MKIRIGQLFRVPSSRQTSQPGDFYSLSRGRHSTGVNSNRGIFYYAALKDPGGVTRIPAFLLYSDNLLSLFVLAYNLGNFLRRLCLPKAVKHWSLRSVQVKLIKMGGRLVRHSRWLIFQLSEVSAPRRLFQGVLDRIGRLSAAPS